MRLVLLSAATLIVTSSALAQTSQPLRASAPAWQGAPYYGGLGASTNTKSDICLINKKTKKQVCKDRLGWRREAARIDRMERTKANPR